MKLTTISLLFFVLSMVEVYRTLLRLKKETIGIRSGVIWLIMWSGIGVFSVFPQVLDNVMVFAQMKNRMFFVLILAVFILFSVVFNLNSKVDKLQRNLEILIQELSIQNYKISGLPEQHNNNNTRKDTES